MPALSGHFYFKEDSDQFLLFEIRDGSSTP